MVGVTSHLTGDQELPISFAVSLCGAELQALVAAASADTMAAILNGPGKLNVRKRDFREAEVGDSLAVPSHQKMRPRAATFML